MVKGWKQTSEGKRIIWLSENAGIEVFASSGQLGSGKKFRDWIVQRWNIIDGQAEMGGKTLKRFKTKSQALKYAKAYMRSH